MYIGVLSCYHAYTPAEGTTVKNSAAEDHTREKTVEIIVNAQPHDVAKGEISFEAVVAIAYPQPPAGPNVVFTVTYSRGEEGKQGSLTGGKSVKVKEGMVFVVRVTDRS
jgi:hypothetical protein